MTSSSRLVLACGIQLYRSHESPEDPFCAIEDVLNATGLRTAVGFPKASRCGVTS